ncbi:MAG: MBL fold metallo-hydrolase, partial [Bacteroidota bacterium]
HLEALLFTHEHKDHVAGLDDVRAFNFKQNRHMPIYATKFVQQTLKREFLYAFAHDLYPGVPLLKLETIEAGNEFIVDGVKILPIEVMHGKLPVMAYRIGDFSYITDANAIKPESMQLLRGTKVLVLNALRSTPHHSHFSLEEAIRIAQDLGAEKTYFTHISHLLGKHREMQEQLPPGMWLAYDGLSLEVR